MLNEFKGFIGYDEEEFKELWENALIVVDTNILLNFYKFSSKQSTQSLFAILKKLKDENRLWIPHQVALEYFCNYEENMFKQTEGYKTLRDKLVKLKTEAEKEFSTVKSTHPYIVTEKFDFFVESLQESNEELEERINKEIEELPKAETTKEKILELMKGIIGQPYTQKKIDNIESDGVKRFNNQVPPGWEDEKDKSKNKIRIYGSLQYNQKFGDLILWNQMIDKAKVEENSTPIIFLTEEKKADWWEKDGRKIKRPQPNLIHEFKEKTGQKFYMYRTDIFVKLAKEYLSDSVTEQDVENFTKDLEFIRKSDERMEEIVNKNNDLLKILRNNFSNPSKKFKDVNLDKLMEFLVEDEKVHFKNEIKIAFSEREMDLSNNLYNDAIAWALEVVSPRIMDRAIDLISTLATRDYDKANEYRVNLYHQMPDEKIAKGLMLLKFVESLETEIRNIEIDRDYPF